MYKKLNDSGLITFDKNSTDSVDVWKEKNNYFKQWEKLDTNKLMKYKQQRNDLTGSVAKF